MATSNGNVVALGDHPRARARLSPQESASLLSGCRELAMERMTRALGTMLDRVEDELFTLAEKAGDREAQNVLLDARAQARGKRSVMEATFRRQFAEFFNRKVRGDEARGNATLGELSLVGAEELEESLAVDEMSRKARAACEAELFALGQRMGFLLERPEMGDDANPLGPAAMCNALKVACDQVEAGFKVRMALLHQLESHMMAELQVIYRDLNAHLVERRVLPDVRPVARRNPSGAKPAARDDKADAPKDLFSTLADLMKSPPAGLVGGGGGGMPGGLPGEAGGLSAAAAPFVESLTHLHRDNPSGIDARSSMVNVVREVRASPQAASLPPLEATTIDIVAMLFDYVFEDRHIPDSIKALLGRLQIPTLKVALLDKAFFSSKVHPARRLIDLLAEVSIGVDPDYPRGARTLALVEEVVDTILAEFGTDLALYERLVARVEAFAVEARLADDDIVQRSAAIVEARERTEIALAAAEDEVTRRLANRSWVPVPVREMLHGTWTRAFAAAYEAMGTQGAWVGLGQTVDDLLWSVEPKVQAEDRKRLVATLPTLLKALQDGFELAKAQPGERDAFLGALVDCHAAAIKAGLRGLAALPDVPPVPPAPGPVAIEREMVPADGVQVEEIRLRVPKGVVRNVFTRTGIWTNVPRGTWVEFGRAGGDTTRARLTWISPNKGVYLFTNPASKHRALSISPEALAEQMRLGEARILDDAPLVDRAVDSMLANLRQAQPA